MRQNVLVLCHKHKTSIYCGYFRAMEAGHFTIVMKLREGAFIVIEGHFDICPTGGYISLNRW